MKLLPETLKKYFVPEIAHFKTIFNLDGKYKKSTFNLESYYKEMQTIFNVKEADYKPEETRNNNGTLTFQDYENYCKKQKENLFNLDEEAIPSQLLCINELFVDNQDYAESLKAFNNTYINQLVGDNKKMSKLSPSELKFMFYIFPSNQDYAEKLKKIKEFMSINVI